MSDWQARERATSRRPISPNEVAYLERMGAQLREWRLELGLSQERLAWSADLSLKTIARIEAGTRRTRHSTLMRIAQALEAAGSGADAPTAVEELVALAGPALAPESEYRERVERRRARKAARIARTSARIDAMVEVEPTAEAHPENLRPTRRVDAIGDGLPSAARLRGWYR